MNLLEKIQLDFNIIETGNSKYLIIQDFSDWGAIENQPATIDIKIPNYENQRTFYFNKDSYNRFNTSNLSLSTLGDYKELPDGIYEITLKGSPSSEFCISKKYLKKDKIQLELDTLFLNQGIDFIHCNQSELDKIYEADEWLQYAIAAVKKGKCKEANIFYSKARKLVDEIKHCEQC